MDPDYPPRVYFNEFNPDSFNIRMGYWRHPPRYWDFLAFSEKANLEIFRVLDEHGVQFSLPFRVTHTSIESEEKPVEATLVNERPATWRWRRNRFPVSPVVVGLGAMI